jgi:hypothetical protein
VGDFYPRVSADCRLRGNRCRVAPEAGPVVSAVPPKSRSEAEHKAADPRVAIFMAAAVISIASVVRMSEATSGVYLLWSRISLRSCGLLPAPKRKFENPFKVIWSSSFHTKILLLPRRANQWFLFARPAPDQEGRFAIVTSVGCGMQWTRRARLTRARSRTEKSCGPDIPTLISSLRGDDLAGDGGKKARLAEEITK